ncbi:MAG: oligosaccharide flippase family protein [Phycisphaerales bacterium]
MRLADKVLHKFKNLSGDNKSVLTLVGGTTIAQTLSFLFSPITTRLFSPEVFGDLSVFTSITGIIGIVICLRYELSIVLPKDNDEGFSLLKLCYIFTIIVSGITGIIFLFGSEVIYEKFGAKNLAGYWYYVPLILLLTGIIQASNYWLTRTRMFKILSLNKVLPVIAVNLVSIVLGFMGYKNVGARLAAILVSNIINLVVLAKAIIPEFRGKKHENKYTYRNLIGRYKNYLVYDIWGALLNNLSWLIVPILMNYYYSSTAAGQYSIGMRVIQIPASIIGSSVAQVFLKNASEKLYNKNLYPYCISTIKKLFKYTAPVAIILFLFGKDIFSLIFGEKWSAAGVYTQILAPWAIVWFISSPISSIYTVKQKQNISLITSSLNLVTRVLSLYLGQKYGDDLLGLKLFSLSGICINGLSIYLCLRIAKKNDSVDG